MVVALYHTLESVSGHIWVTNHSENA